MLRCVGCALLRCCAAVLRAVRCQRGERRSAVSVPNLPSLRSVAQGAVAVAAAFEKLGVAADEARSAQAQVLALARSTVAAKAREAAEGALARMKERFGATFGKDERGLPRAWRPTDDLAAIAAAAKADAARVLGLLVAVRLDEELDTPGADLGGGIGAKERMRNGNMERGRHGGYRLACVGRGVSQCVCG